MRRLLGGWIPDGLSIQLGSVETGFLIKLVVTGSGILVRVSQQLLQDDAIVETLEVELAGPGAWLFNVKYFDRGIHDCVNFVVGGHHRHHEVGFVVGVTRM